LLASGEVGTQEVAHPSNLMLEDAMALQLDMKGSLSLFLSLSLVPSLFFFSVVLSLFFLFLS
jgi:hypothetical protein